MGISKRKRADADADAGDDELAAIDKATKSSKKQQMLPSMIKNKEKRSAVHAKIKRDKKIEKRKQAKSRDDARKCDVELDDEPPPKAIPHTIENTREPDETVIRLDDAEARGST